MSESTSFTRMSEQLDHRKLIRKLDDISDQCYKLLQLCQDLEQSIQDHANDDTAHSDIRQEISIIDGKLISLNSSFAQQISDLTGTYNTKIDELTTKDIELEQSISGLHTDIDKITSGDITFDASITSSVTADNIKDANAGTAIINSTAIGGTTAIANLKSPNGRFIIGTNDKGFDIDYTSNIHINNTNPDKQLVLLNEQGNSTFPGTITATEFIGTFNGDITGNAGTADNAEALNGLGSNAFVRKTGNITETITGSKTFSSTIIASAGITGTIDNADKLDNLDSTDFIRKTGSINENITGVKTFDNDIKSDTITAKSGDLTGSIGSVSIRYKSGYIDNIEASTLSGKLTGSLIGNATTATKLAIARKINGTDFNGTSAITTSIWGTARNMSISDNSGLHTGASTGVNGSEDYVIKLPYTITGSFEGNATTATKLAIARKINGTDFNGTSAITTSIWGTARNMSIADATSAHVGSAVSVNGSTAYTLKLPTAITASLIGNASTATSLAVKRRINGTEFNGSADITTANWGTARNISIGDASNTNTGAAVSVNGSANITLKLPSNITATNFYGVASSATKLNSAVTINGTAFDGTANITTAAWGYSRNMQITDSDSSNSGAITAVNGTNNVTLKLPSTIKGTLTGNASTATKATQDSDGNKINTTYSKNGHTHDDRYYTESEVNNLLAGKANTSGTYSGLKVGNATSATKAVQDGNGNVITTTYATKLYVNNEISRIVTTDNLHTLLA